MKKAILFLIAVSSISFASNAQAIWYDAPALDSTTFTFSPGETLVHHLWAGGTTYPQVILDTASNGLWQIGGSVKPVFSSGSVASRGIMTDTVHPYPANANDYFVLKMDSINSNWVVNFWHRYKTGSVHAGGMVEFSTDTGRTWTNVADCWSIGTQNFYSSADTLFSGDAGFSGTSSAEKLSRLQYLNCVGIRPPTAGCSTLGSMTYMGPFYLRFRFVSDAAVDALPGWIIDSIEVENPGCMPGGIPESSSQKVISVSPNPAQNIINVGCPGNVNRLIITDLLGQVVFSGYYNTDHIRVDLADLPKGMYLLRINDRDVRKFVKE